MDIAISHKTFTQLFLIAPYWIKLQMAAIIDLNLRKGKNVKVKAKQNLFMNFLCLKGCLMVTLSTSEVENLFGNALD